MAKKKNNLAPLPPALRAEGEVVEITIRLPVGDLASDGIDQQRVRHIDTANLTRPQSRGIRRVRKGYEQRNERLANGRRVNSNADTVRRICELVEEQVEELFRA